MQSLQGLGTQRSPAVLKKVFLFWHAISFLGGWGGGNAQCLKKIYRPRAIFKTFDPPCVSLPDRHHIRVIISSDQMSPAGLPAGVSRSSLLVYSVAIRNG